MACDGRISEEAACYRALMRHGCREALSQFFNIPELVSWQDDSILHTVQLLLAKGAQVEESALEWARQHRGENGRLLTILSSSQQPQAAGGSSEPSAPAGSSNAASQGWGASSVADVKAVMRHTLRYDRPKQRAIIGAHPDCATALLAVACSMGPGSRDTVHWLLQAGSQSDTGARVDGLDLRECRRLALGRRKRAQARKAQLVARNAQQAQEAAAAQEAAVALLTGPEASTPSTNGHYAHGEQENGLTNGATTACNGHINGHANLENGIHAAHAASPASAQELPSPCSMQLQQLTVDCTDVSSQLPPLSINGHISGTDGWDEEPLQVHLSLSPLLSPNRLASPFASLAAAKVLGDTRLSLYLPPCPAHETSSQCTEPACPHTASNGHAAGGGAMNGQRGPGGQQGAGAHQHCSTAGHCLVGEHSWLDFLSDSEDSFQAEEDEGQDSSKPEVVEGDGDPPELWVLSPLAEAAAAGDQYIVELLLEVYGADPVAHGGLAERMATKFGHHLLAKIIYEKNLQVQQQRSIPLQAATSSSPPHAYATFGDWVSSILPSWQDVKAMLGLGPPILLPARRTSSGRIIVYSNSRTPAAILLRKRAAAQQRAKNLVLGMGVGLAATVVLLCMGPRKGARRTKV